MTYKLPEGWEEVKLIEVIDLTMGQSPKSEFLNEDAQGMPFMQGNSTFGKKYPNIERYTTKVTRLAKINDVLMSVRAPVGDLNICNIKEVCIGRGLCSIRMKNNMQEFVYYLMEYNMQQLRSRESGTVFASINKGDLESLPINLPPIQEQKAIADTLSSLDNKIENNNKVNENLEEQAQVIFKHWFVDFEFPDENGNPYKSSGGEMVESELGMIPKGWEVKTLDNIAEFLNGVAIAKYKPQTELDETLPAVKIREMRQGFTDGSSDRCLTSVDRKYIINDYDMLFAWSGSLIIDIWVGGESILNQHLFKVTSDEYEKWYYYYWSKHFLDEFIEIARNKATTMGHINRSHLSDAKVLLPNKKRYKEMGSFFDSILNLKMKSRKENQKLSELRDTLLPKLMSGEIRIPLD